MSMTELVELPNEGYGSAGCFLQVAVVVITHSLGRFK